MVLEGNIESKYLFATLLGKDLIPFGFVEFRPVVLPLESTPNGFRFSPASQMKNNMSDWLKQCQKFWEEKRTAKSKTNFPVVTDRLDRHGLLTVQKPSNRFVVLYNCRGSDSMTFVLDRRSLPAFTPSGTEIKPTEFVAEATTYYYETNDENEAHYLCSVLNSDIVHKLVKPFQPRGAYGNRDLSRRPFMLPIPEFDGNNAEHKSLASIGKECHQKILSTKFDANGFRSMRNESKLLLKQELKSINDLVKSILH
ncbi:MAG: hypothetical protein JRN15_24440, partial [Nitrososphaerota archaeon]|nr:hypothetical protein [Nitrososphaerota archaeon]